MAINKAMRAALTALSHQEIDIKKNYALERELMKLASKRLIKPPLYHIWEHKVSCGGREIPVRIFVPPDVSDTSAAHASDDIAPITPPGGKRRLVLIFFHGGGWVTGDIDSYDGVCADMAYLTGRIVVSVDYSLAPEHRFPAAPEDCYAVAREIFLDGG